MTKRYANMERSAKLLISALAGYGSTDPRKLAADHASRLLLNKGADTAIKEAQSNMENRDVAAEGRLFWTYVYKELMNASEV